MNTLEVTIPGPPGHASANRARRHAVVMGRATSYQSQDSKAWRRVADRVFRDALEWRKGERFDPRRRIYVHITSVWPRWSKKYGVPLGDVDNVAKQVCDAIVRAGIVADDLLVAELCMSKEYDPAAPCIRVTIQQGTP